ncbi:FkbM family methyltransferase [Streptomyces sp. GC420]|nr:FkbM family methyltransferase [Streptomyces sp. GC420]
MSLLQHNRPGTLIGQARGAVRRLGREPGTGRRPRDVPQPVRLLPPHEIDLVLDVGAHTGAYGAMLRRHGYRGRIVSFEPLAQARVGLRGRAEGDDLWTVLPFALGERTGPAELRVAGEDGAGTSMLPALPLYTLAAPHETCARGRVTVDMCTLEELWEGVVAPGERVFVRLDVQGYEGHVLRGAGAYAAECAGFHLTTELVPLHGGGLGFVEALRTATAGLGMTPMGVVPGLSDPRTGQLLRCELVLMREDRGDAESQRRQAASCA